MIKTTVLSKETKPITENLTKYNGQYWIAEDPQAKPEVVLLGQGYTKEQIETLDFEKLKRIVIRALTVAETREEAKELIRKEPTLSSFKRKFLINSLEAMFYKAREKC